MSSQKRKKLTVQQLANFRVASDVTSDAVRLFLQSLDCPRSLTVLMLFESGEHEQLAELECNPLHYSDVAEFRDAYAATKLLLKYEGLRLPYDLDVRALEKFEKYELLCKQTNVRFKNLAMDPKFHGPVVWLHNAVVRKISRILGPLDAEEIFSLANWGPGATTLIPSSRASSTNKFQCETGITRDLYDLIPLQTLEGSYPRWSEQLQKAGFPSFQVGNKIVTVPKDATANRVIAIEPGINLWFQKGIGEVIGSRLRRFGIDLRYQSQNQELARIGSLTRFYATLDLSSASDSIAKEVVREVLPPRWFSFLDSARSQYGKLGERLIRWEKFSSMGNGFTFQLESLIFFALCSACAEYLQIEGNGSFPTVSVYGDDLIIPVRCLDLVSSMLDFYGFNLNVKKSHYSSTFRESCGSHYMDGVDVKPIYLKGSLSDVRSVYRLANAVRRLSSRWSYASCDKRFRAVFVLLKRSVPRDFRLLITESIGDGGFISNFDEATPVRARHCIEGYYVVNVIDVPKRYESEEAGLLLARLRNASTQEERNTVPLRGRTKMRIIRTLVKQWDDLGPWI